MFYKVIYDGIVIDVLDQLNYVAQNQIYFVVSVNTAEEAMGILSSDLSEIWHLDTLPNFPSGNFKTVSIVEIDENEYLDLATALDIGKQIPYVPTVIDDSDDETEQDPVSAESKEDTPNLVSLVKVLISQVETLENCLLEISEDVYQ